MRTRAIIVSILTALAAASASLTLAAKPVSNLPITGIINDFDSGVGPALQIQNDGSDHYTTSKTFDALILGDGDLQLDDYYLADATRKVCVNFTQPIPGSGPNGGDPVAPPSGCFVSNLPVDCSNDGHNFATVPAGQTVQCPMNVHFDSGGLTYDLHMSGGVNFPETSAVNVTCIFPTSGTKACSQWRVWPSVQYQYNGLNGPATGYRNVANLSYETTVKGKVAYVRQGDFYISFSILVTNP